MSLLLDVPYAQKDAAKALGAKWNPEIKKWYVEKRSDYTKFRPWFHSPKTTMIVCDQIYIVQSYRECFYCHKKTPIVSLAADSYVLVGTSEIKTGGDIDFLCWLIEMPQRLQEFLKPYHVSYKYSNVLHKHYFGSCCYYCKLLQGDNYAHFDPKDAPFYMQYKKRQKLDALKIHKLQLKNDLELCCTLCRYLDSRKGAQSIPAEDAKIQYGSIL